MNFIDKMFQAPANRGRLNRKQMENKDDQSPDTKPDHLPRQNNTEKLAENAPRYGAQRRLQAQKKTE